LTTVTLLSIRCRYLFDFLGTAEIRRERDLEAGLIEHMERFSFSIRAVCWRQGNCAALRCTIASSGQAAAKALMYLRLRGE